MAEAAAVANGASVVNATPAVRDMPDGSCWAKPKSSAAHLAQENNAEAAANTSVNSQDPDQFTQNTQPMDEDSPFFVDSQEGKLEYFGYLQQKHSGGGILGLEKGCEFSVGRSTGNNLVIQPNNGFNNLFNISKVQFVIREDPRLGGVSIEDRSSNGTFVNGERLSKGKRKPLANNDAIGMASAKATNFVFISGSMDEQNSPYPHELRIKYAMARELGKGASGAVMLGVRRSDNTQVAIKVMDKEKLKGLPRGVLNEVNLLKAVDHPCIIRLEDVVETDKELFIALELAEGGDLFERIVSSKRLEEKKAKLYFYQMLEAVKYLHSMNIAHRDLKPENILLSTDQANPVIKVTDFGMSKLFLLGSNLKTFCGTPQYLAPEVLFSRVRGDGTYSHACDMWSLGVILYVMLSGTPAFNPERRDKDMVKQITEADYSFPEHIWKNISIDAIDLIRRLMTVRAADRLTAEAALEHSWFDDPDVLIEARALMESQRRTANATQPPQPPSPPPPNEDLTNAAGDDATCDASGPLVSEPATSNSRPKRSLGEQQPANAATSGAASNTTSPVTNDCKRMKLK